MALVIYLILHGLSGQVSDKLTCRKNDEFTAG